MEVLINLIAIYIHICVCIDIYTLDIFNHYWPIKYFKIKGRKFQREDMPLHFVDFVEPNFVEPKMNHSICNKIGQGSESFMVPLGSFHSFLCIFIRSNICKSPTTS